MPRSITAEFSLNTPLFSSGADKTKPELRVSEIKAALRFWWRAMNYGLYATNRSRFVNVESQLFGSAKESHGQGAVVSVKPVSESLKRRYAPEIHSDFTDAPGARYLGYGLMEFAHAKANPEKGKPEKFPGQLLRACIDPGWSFTLQLVWRNVDARRKTHDTRTLSDEEFQNHLLQAIKAFGLFGGLGSRSRRGYGSVTLHTLQAGGQSAWIVPTDVAGLKTVVQTLLHLPRQAQVGTPDEVEYSAFTSHSRSTVVGMDNGRNSNGYQLLNAMGSAFVRYRAWGRQDKILDGEPANQIFVDDHNWFRGGRVRGGFEHPDRIVFGLPHPYGEKIWGGADIRRASPLFFHVHRPSATQHFGVIFDLRSRFLPNDEKLKDPIRGSKVSVSPDWTLLDDVLDGQISLVRNGVPSYVNLFPNAVCTSVF